MVELLFFIFVLLLAVLGLAELIHSVKLCLLAPKEAAISYKIIFLKGSLPQHQLKIAVEQSAWSGKKLTGNIIAVNSFLEGEALEECRFIAQKNGVIFCSAEELCDQIMLISGKT
ncbi:MAG: hypothetical protein IKD04_03025 [Clostridia bacterium]|nr:hypothetical protein [Clostridia bacterium]